VNIISKYDSKELKEERSNSSRIQMQKTGLSGFRNYKMNRPIRLLAVGSSMRENSFSTLAAKLVLHLSNKKYGADTRLLDLRQTELPIYNPEDSSESNTQIQYLVEWADAFILASPDYHGSMSGVMKNFLDHFWAEFAGKLFGFICASHEKGLTVMDQMRTAVRQCYGWSMPYGISINGEEDFNDRAEITNVLLNKRLGMFARDIIVYGDLIRAQFLQDIVDDKLLDTFAIRYKKSLLAEQKPLIT
jgi:azobenzene reductase